MLHDKAQQALEQILHAGFGKEAGDDFNVLLGCGHNGVDTSCCRVGQRIRVKTLRGCRDARAAFLDGIHILQDREGGLAHEGHCEGRHSALAALADDGTRFGVHHILDAHLALHDRHTRVDRLRKAVKRVAHDDRLDALNVHHRVSDRHAEEVVRLGVGAERSEGRIVASLIAQNLIAYASDAHLAQFSHAVAVTIHADVCFDVGHLAHCRIGAVAAIVGQRRVAGVTLDVGIQFVGVGR